MHIPKKESTGAEENYCDDITFACTPEIPECELSHSLIDTRAGRMRALHKSARPRILREVDAQPGVAALCERANLSHLVTEISQKKVPYRANSFRFSTSNSVNGQSEARPEVAVTGSGVKNGIFSRFIYKGNETFSGNIRYTE
jgi:hypothetical protein